MAFGFGFNKQKVLSAAEKFVQQGKLPNAISEYEKVLKADPKDLTVMNTVGDLYSRLGNIDKAVDCFKSVGDAYASQGFTVKAIAMYKKLSKIKHSFEGVLRLAELYTQQGLFNDARAQYLQVAEEFLRSGELEQAVRIFQKTLEMDPDNVAMRSKLAEVYVRLGKKAEAWQVFSAAVETLRSRGQLEGAETLLQRMLTLDPGNSYALLLRGRTAADTGDTVTAIQYLEKVADLDSHPEGMSALFKAYLQTGRTGDARVLAGKMLSVHNDPAPIISCAETMMASGQHEEALQIYQEYSDSLLSSDPTKVLESLRSLISHVRDNPTSLETILALFTKAGENSHMTELYELLANAYVQSGDLEKARDYYQKLTQLEPQNQLHARNFQQLSEKLGGAAPRLISSEEGSILIEELEATAPFIDQRYEDDVALTVRAALTDAELFISYNMPEKAVAPLLSVLPQAPQDQRLNQRLAALHNRAERFDDAAICCRILESVYHDAGYPDEATRYGELAARYEERATSAGNTKLAQAAEPQDAIAAPFESDLPAVALETPARGGLFFHVPSASASPAAQEFHVEAAQPVAESEIDLSSEWDGASFDLAQAPHTEKVELPTVEPALEVTPNIPEDEPPTWTIESPVGQISASGTVEIPVEEVAPKPVAAEAALTAEITEEVRFYIDNSMLDLAHAALAKLEQLNPYLDTLPALREEISNAVAKAAAHREPVVEISVEEPLPDAMPLATQSVEAEAPVESPVEVAIAPPDMHAAPHSFTSDLAGPINEAPSEELSIKEAPEEASVAPEFSSSHVAPEIAAEVPLEPAPVAESEPQHAAVAQTKPAPEVKPVEAVAEAQPEIAEPAVAHSEEATDALAGIVSDIEASLGNDFVPAAPVEPAMSAARASIQAPGVLPPSDTHVPAIAPPSLAPAAMAAAAPGSSSISSPATAPPTMRHQSTAFTTFKPPVPIHPPVTKEVPPPTVAVSVGIDLADMFGELKHELEADNASSMDEDPETHYSLGVAFREMGLLDEAIGELQKVCQTVEHGHPFPQILQTYTWLAQCFLDKGIPEAALRWYERALTLPTINPETRMALHYELACACENAGDRPTALHHFMEVYGSNIDYRDVSERIKALRS